MLQDLDAASHQSADSPSAPPLVVAQRLRTGKRGRPKVAIEKTFLTQALQLRGPTHIAPVVGCSPRTVRWRALEYQLADPAPAVFTMNTRDDGTVVHTRTAWPSVADDFSEEELDSVIRAILEVGVLLAAFS